MKVLVVGGGGREHALCWKIAQSPRVKQLHCAPGNAGIAQIAECHAIAATDLDGIVGLAQSRRIDLVVVGPEDPLCLGLVDRLTERGIAAFGPTAAAAAIEGSKAFCKDLLRRHRVPTPGFRTFEDPKYALAYLETLEEYPVVIKASGLAAGKGVTICEHAEQARTVAQELMKHRKLGEAGATIVVEEFVRGPEVSVLAITDGQAIMPLEPARDHKRLKDGDLGPNTGGMGAVCPVTLPPRMRQQVDQQILLPVVHAMNREGRPFKGVLYAGLMMTAKGPVVLEFNARFGDPETQAVLPRIEDDLLPYLEAAAKGTLEKLEGPRFDRRVSVSVVAASEGYPEKPETGRPIRGLDAASGTEGVHIFHAGTKRSGENVVTTGGRVLAVTALGDSVEEARSKAYTAMDKIDFVGKQVRRDIALKEV